MVFHIEDNIRNLRVFYEYRHNDNNDSNARLIISFTLSVDVLRIAVKVS